MTDSISPQGNPEFDLGKDDIQLSDSDWETAQKVLRPETFMFVGDRLLGYLAEKLALTGLPIPISQIAGFPGFTPNFATRVETDENTASVTYTDLSTVGPTLSGLEDGLYLVFFGAHPYIDTGDQIAYMSVSINGAAASDTGAVRNFRDEISDGGLAMISAVLDSGNNTIEAKYRSELGVGANFRHRWLAAIKQSNT